ncbi:MAG: tetratricopeptide (TPR) repeat protein [Saprospiraceae bacterium]|jgi:tetratricopeptide (TPR) repeat protein
MKNRIFYITLFIAFSFFGNSQNVNDFSADNYFNAGNEAYNNKQFGEAVYQFEKALLLDPNSQDILINLNLAAERLDADIIALDPFFLASWWRSLSDVFLPGTWKMGSIILLIGLLILVFMHLFKNKLTSKLAYSLGSGLIFLILISILTGVTRAHSIFNNDYAILSGKVDSLLEGPDSVSEKIKPVVSGVKVKILDSNAQWYRVATMDSEQGWVLKSEVRLLKFAK